MEAQVESGSFEDAKLREDIEKAKKMSALEKEQALAKLLQMPAEKRFDNPLKIKLLIELVGIEMVNFNAETYVEPSFTYYNVSPMTSAGFRNDDRGSQMIELYLCEYLKMKYQGKDNPELYKEIVKYYEASFLGYYSKSRYLFPDKMRDFDERFKKAMQNAEKELKDELGDAFSSDKLHALNEEFEEKFIPDAYQVQQDGRARRGFDAFVLSMLVVTIPFVWTWYAVKAAQDPIKPKTVESLKERSKGKQQDGVENYPDVLTSQADLDAMEELPQSDLYKHVPHALNFACKTADPKMVKVLLNQKKENDQPLFSTRDAFINIFLPLKEKHSNWWEKEGLRWVSHGNFEEQKKIFAEKKTDVEDMKNRELCIRLILQHEKAKLKKEFPKLSDDEVNKQVADQFINTRYIITEGNYISESGILYVQPYVGDACGLIKVISQELGVENIDFTSKNGPRNHGWSPMTDAACFIKEPKFKMFEVYLCEYLKMSYEGKTNDTLYYEIKKFLYNRDFANDFFLEKMKMLPEILAKAEASAKNELQQKYGEEFDEAKLTKAADQFEEKIMPDAYQMQMQRRSDLFSTIAPLLVVIIATGIFIPVVAAWFAYKIAKEPIKMTKTTSGAYDLYSKSQERKEPSEEDISLGESSRLTSSYGSILEDTAKAEKKPHERKAKTEGHAEWRVPAVVKHAGDKVRIFTLNKGQAKRMGREIRQAEKEQKRGSERRPLV